MAYAFRLAPFFAAGYLAARLPWRLAGGSAGARVVACAAIVATLCLGAVLAWEAPLEGVARRATGLGLGLTFCLALLVLRPRHAGLARLGRHSYPVYLLHVFFTAATLEALARLAPGAAVIVVWAMALLAGLVGPILMESLLLRWPLAAGRRAVLRPSRSGRHGAEAARDRLGLTPSARPSPWSVRGTGAANGRDARP